MKELQRIRLAPCQLFVSLNSGENDIIHRTCYPGTSDASQLQANKHEHSTYVDVEVSPSETMPF